MQTIKAIAIDDEPLALRVIENHAAKIPYLDLVTSTTKVMDMLLLIQKQPIDLIFLDVLMPDLTGIQFVKLIQGKQKVIITTAYQEYALDGYEYDVVDYLLKPISFERFLKASQKAYNQIMAENYLFSPGESISSGISETSPTHDFIFVKTEHRMLKIRHADILFIEGGKDYITIYTAAEKIMSLASLSKLLENLPQPQFMRVHKSYVVALDKIDSIERQRIFINTQVIPIGDTYKDEFIKQIGGI